MSGVARAGLGSAMSWDAYRGGFRAGSRLGLAGQPAGIQLLCAMSFLQAEQQLLVDQEIIEFEEEMVAAAGVPGSLGANGHGYSRVAQARICQKTVETRAKRLQLLFGRLGLQARKLALCVALCPFVVVEYR